MQKLLWKLDSKIEQYLNNLISHSSFERTNYMHVMVVRLECHAQRKKLIKLYFIIHKTLFTHQIRMYRLRQFAIHIQFASNFNLLTFAAVFIYCRSRFSAVQFGSADSSAEIEQIMHAFGCLFVCLFVCCFWSSAVIGQLAACGFDVLECYAFVST